MFDIKNQMLDRYGYLFDKFNIFLKRCLINIFVLAYILDANS